MTAPRFLRDRRGIAAVEAALILPVFLFLMVVAIDFAFAFQARNRLAGALTLGSQYAMQAGGTLTEAAAASFARTIQAAVAEHAGRVEDLTVEVTFNGSANAADIARFYCPSGATLRSTGTSAQPCGDGSVSGRFVTPEVRGHVSSLFPDNPVFGRSVDLYDAITVRLP